MGIKFSRYIIKCMNERTDEIVNDVAANDKTFKELTQKVIPILDTIKDTLPSEYKELFEELEDILDKRELITYRMLYKQGLKDGIRLYNVFHAL